MFYSGLLFFLLNVFLISTVSVLSIQIVLFIALVLLYVLHYKYAILFEHAFTVNSQVYVWTYLKLIYPIYIYSLFDRLFADIYIIQSLTLVLASIAIFMVGLNASFMNRFMKIMPLISFGGEIGQPWKISKILVFGFYFLAVYGIFKTRELGINHFLGADLARSNANILFTFLIQIKVYLVIIMFYWCLRDRRFLILTILLLVELLLGLYDGGRSALLKPFLWLFFIMAYTNGYYRISFFNIINLFLMVLLLIVPFLTIYKDALLNVLFKEESFSINLEVINNALFSMDLSKSNIIYNIFDSNLHFSGMFEGLQRVAMKVPNLLDYTLGATFLPSWLTGLVPRILWADKPIYRPGRYFSVNIFDHNSNVSDDGVSQGIGIIAEMFLNFGFFGFVLFFFLGLYVKFFWVRLKYYKAHETYEIYLVRAFFVVMKISLVLQMNLSTFWIGGLRETLFCYIFFILLTCKFPKVRF